MAGPYTVEVGVRGDVSPKAVEEARRHVGAMGRFARDRILFARVKLEQAADPARDRPAVARAVLDLNGTPVHAVAAEETMEAAVDALAARLRDRLDHLTGRRRALRRGSTARRRSRRRARPRLG